MYARTIKGLKFSDQEMWMEESKLFRESLPLEFGELSAPMMKTQ